MAEEKTYYQILGVLEDVSEAEIKRAYHKLARDLHPDKALSAEESKEKEEQFALVSEAYNVLKDAARRKEYDYQLKVQRRQELASKETGAEAFGDREKERKQIARRAYVRGVNLMRGSDYERAYEFLEKAVELHPDNGEYLIALARAIMATRRGLRRAVVCCERAMDLEPFNFEFKQALAEIYELTGVTSLAIKHYEELVRWDRDNQKAKEALSRIKKEKPTSRLLSWLSQFFRVRR